MADPLKKPPGKTPKGKPLGIPMWGWLIAAAIGIVIGYTILKQSKSASALDSTGGIANADGSAIPPDAEEKGSGAGMPPLEDILRALGLRGSSSVVGEDSSPGSSSESASFAVESSSEPPPPDKGFFDPVTGKGDTNFPEEIIVVNGRPVKIGAPDTWMIALGLADPESGKIDQKYVDPHFTQSATSMPGSSNATTSNAGYQESMQVAQSVPTANGVPISAGFGGFDASGNWTG